MPPSGRHDNGSLPPPSIPPSLPAVRLRAAPRTSAGARPALSPPLPSAERGLGAHPRRARAAVAAMRRGERRGPGGALGKAALEEQPDGPGPRRSTESEVYDDGTNTFFW